MKTLSFEECANQIAKKHGFGNWAKIISTRAMSNTQFIEWQNEAAELYASNCSKEAIRLARETETKFGVGDMGKFGETGFTLTEQEILDQLFKPKA